MGFLATANTKTIEGYKPHLSNVWAQPYRMQRIQEVLSSRNDFTVEDMKNLQMDTKNLYAKDFSPKFLNILGKENIKDDVYNQLNNCGYL